MKKKSIILFIALGLFSCGTNTENNGEMNLPAVAKPTAKYILKSVGNQYVIIDKNNFSLVANQSEASKAEVFEEVDLNDGKFGLKSSQGKYIADNRNGANNIIVFNDWVGEWEKFDIIKLDSNKINIRSSAGKFVGIEESKGNVLYANRDKAGQLETFIMEKK